MNDYGNGRRGMTLVELIIVMGVLGVLFAAVYTFFIKGTEQFHFARRQNNLATSGRLALEQISDELLWAGYMPEGGWDEDDWHPVETAENGYLSFYFDRVLPHGSLEDNDYRHIFLQDNVIHITDNGLMNRMIGSNVVDLQFNYLDSEGSLLSKPLTPEDCDAVRHVVIKLTLQDTYMGDVYQTVMQTMITPRNLGVVHNFNPEFYPPGPPDAKIVVNINGDSAAPAPTVSQLNLLSTLDHWGYTLVQLTDDQLAGYPYEDTGVDLVILRDMDGSGATSHVSIDAALDSIPIPIIALDPTDAVDCFDMGLGTGTHNNALGHMYKDVPTHEIHDGIVDIDYGADSLMHFDIYDDTLASRGRVNWIDSVYTPEPDWYTVTSVLPPVQIFAGVVVANENDDSQRRVFYAAPQFEQYSWVGYDFLRNVIEWGLPETEPPPLGEEIVLESFEGDPPENVEMTFWTDSLEGGAWLPDSIVLYQDFHLGGTHEMMWSYVSSGYGRIQRTPENVMQTDRVIAGGFDQNTLGTVLDLSNYNALFDDLYMRGKTNIGQYETIGPEDGIFLVTGGSTQVLVGESFENLVLEGGDVTFWSDLHGRARVHSLGWGGNTTRYATLDSDLYGSYGTNRMIIEVDTSELPDSSTISVNYLMSDQGDSSHPYNPGTKTGDFVGWSLSSDISAPLEGYIDLEPGTQANGNWYGGSYNFMPVGAMPDTIYVIFGQYDDAPATSGTAHAGMSFDDIYILAGDATGTFEKVGDISSGGGINPFHIDLDDAAIAAGIPFSENFAIAVRQGGTGPLNDYGVLWTNFEIGVIGSVYNAPGWDHGPVIAKETDDWVLERILGNHKYTLHANNLSSYSNNVDCWLESPEFGIPSGTYDAVLSYTQKLEMETGWDFGWVEISTDSGDTWEVLESSAYNSVYDGHGAFSGYMPEQVIELGLDDYAGYSIKVRFMFHSDATGVRDGWQLDDFRAYGTVAGLLIDQIGFKPEVTGGSWFFDTVDVYLGRTTDTYFDASGELDKDLMTYCGTYAVSPTASEWLTIDLTTPFILLAGTNLQVKMEMNQTTPSSGLNWITANRPGMTREEQSPGGDPGLLKVSDSRPALMVHTITYGSIFVDGDSTGTSGIVPLSFSSEFSDFEGLYLMSELGFTIDIDWIHGGTNDDWEIGAPVFIPDIDPDLMLSNGNAIAGNDLTDDGLYNFDCWSWIQSPPYDISDAVAYDSIALGYDRCLRMAINDKAWIQMAFTETTDPPESGDWITVAEYTYQDEDWLQDVIQLTSQFNDAVSNGKNYYLVRFIMDAGPFAEKGGWNIDNVGFYGRNGI